MNTSHPTTIHNKAHGHFTNFDYRRSIQPLTEKNILIINKYNNNNNKYINKIRRG